MVNEIDFEAVRAWYNERMNSKPFTEGTWREQVNIDGVIYAIELTVRSDRTTGIKIDSTGYQQS